MRQPDRPVGAQFRRPPKRAPQRLGVAPVAPPQHAATRLTPPAPIPSLLWRAKAAQPAYPHVAPPCAHKRAYVNRRTLQNGEYHVVSSELISPPEPKRAPIRRAPDTVAAAAFSPDRAPARLADRPAPRAQPPVIPKPHTNRAPPAPPRKSEPPHAWAKISSDFWLAVGLLVKSPTADDKWVRSQSCGRSISAAAFVLTTTGVSGKDKRRVAATTLAETASRPATAGLTATRVWSAASSKVAVWCEGRAAYAGRTQALSKRRLSSRVSACVEATAPKAATAEKATATARASVSGGQAPPMDAETPAQGT